MSEQKVTESVTNVAGYFNPHTYPIFVEISEINLKAELAPGSYIRDRAGRYINDPIFEPWCHAKGLSRAKSDKQVPIVYVPRFVKSTRPAASVSQATGFVRDTGGRTVPTFPAKPPTPRPVSANKTPHTGMTMEAARKLGFVGKPRLVDENYGAEETNGAPGRGPIPTMKYSMESPPKIKSSGVLRPELTEADEDLAPEERVRRMELQRSLSQASSTPTGDNFDPARVRPMAPTAPVALKAPETPTAFTSAGPTTPPPAKAKAKGKPQAKPSAVKVTPTRRVAAPVAPPPPTQPVAIEPMTEEEEVVTDQPLVDEANPEETTEVEPGSGVVQPLDESQESPIADTPPPDARGRKFICAADGKGFNHRSELERHVTRHYPDMLEVYMAPYPAP
jgi:hypothetical protein